MIPKKFLWISTLLAILLTAATVPAGSIYVYDNYDFEADRGLVENAGDVKDAIPTGWHFDDYYVDNAQLKLINVDGEIGVQFPEASAPGAWGAAMTRFDQTVEAGHYTYTTTFMGRGLIDPNKGYNWFYSGIYAINDPSDPWKDGGYEKLKSTGDLEVFEEDNDEWQTLVLDFEILDSDPFIDGFFAPYIESWVQKGGSIILGEASLTRSSPVPEPGTMLLVGAGVLGLAGIRKRFQR